MKIAKILNICVCSLLIGLLSCKKYRGATQTPSPISNGNEAPIVDEEEQLISQIVNQRKFKIKLDEDINRDDIIDYFLSNSEGIWRLIREFQK